MLKRLESLGAANDASVAKGTDYRAVAAKDEMVLTFRTVHFPCVITSVVYKNSFQFPDFLKQPYSDLKLRYTYISDTERGKT